MFTEFTNNTIYLRDYDIINQVYDQLRKHQAPRKNAQNEISLSTKAGEFVLAKDEVSAGLRQLRDWDKQDTPSSPKIDGDISEVTLQLAFLKERESENRFLSGKYGFALKFKKFTPNETWKKNYACLESYMREGRIRLKYNDSRVIRDFDNLWLHATTATLAGITPDLFAAAEQMCNPSKRCAWTLYIQEGIAFASQPFVYQNGHLRLEAKWSMTTPIDARKLKYLFTHEWGHAIYHKAATMAGKEGFSDLLIEWAGGQKKYQEAVKVFSDIYGRYSMYDDQEAKRLLFTMAYVIEEIGDLPYTRYANPDLVSLQDADFIAGLGKRLAISPGDFEKQLTAIHGNILNGAISQAIMISRTRALEPAKTRRFEENMREILKDKRETLALFNAFITLSDAVEEYIETPEFQALIDQELPAVFRESAK